MMKKIIDSINRNNLESLLINKNQNQVSKKMRFFAERVPTIEKIEDLKTLDRLFYLHFKLDKTTPKFACTSAEIFERKTYSGCSDIGLAVAPILRLKGILTIYIESAHIDWMKEVQKGKIEQQPMQGHIFLEIYLNKTWYLYDPTFHLIYCNYDYDNSFLPRGYVVFAKGMNCHELGIHSVQDSMLIEYVDPTQYKEPAYRTIDLKKADS